MSLLLKAGGHQTQVAFDGREAIRRAEEFAPDVILLDIGLPGINDCDTCRAIRREPWEREIAIFALTGWGNPTTASEAKPPTSPDISSSRSLTTC